MRQSRTPILLIKFQHVTHNNQSIIEVAPDILNSSWKRLPTTTALKRGGGGYIRVGRSLSVKYFGACSFGTGAHITLDDVELALSNIRKGINHLYLHLLTSATKNTGYAALQSGKGYATSPPSPPKATREINTT